MINGNGLGISIDIIITNIDVESIDIIDVGDVSDHSLIHCNLSLAVDDPDHIESTFRDFFISTSFFS